MVTLCIVSRHCTTALPGTGQVRPTVYRTVRDSPPAEVSPVIMHAPQPGGAVYHLPPPRCCSSELHGHVTHLTLDPAVVVNSGALFINCNNFRILFIYPLTVADKIKLTNQHRKWGDAKCSFVGRVNSVLVSRSCEQGPAT